MDNPNQKFDILSYLNDLYMSKVTPSIDVLHSGGYHNIHDNNNKAEEQIEENNKKRIHIPNAEIKHFQAKQQGNFEEYNEPTDEGFGDEQSRKDGKGDYVISDETEQKGRIGGSLAEKVVKISDGPSTALETIHI